MPQTDRESTLPKPFVFVLMPLREEFSDIYKFGIKGAAEEVGAYAERIDEQIFTEGILDRIFTQISKADVVVADMTGRNPNVFYEVGYAHALGKVTILLTQQVEDIPFDLKHRQHIVYGGKIDGLKRDLTDRLRWAIEESHTGHRQAWLERLTLFVHGLEASRPGSGREIPTVEGASTRRDFSISLQLRNDSKAALNPISHIYLLSNSSASLVPTRDQLVQAGGIQNYNLITYNLGSYRTAVPLDPLSAGLLDGTGDFNALYRLPNSFPAMPPGAVELTTADFTFQADKTESDDHFRLRILSSVGFHEFDFRLRIRLQKKEEEGQKAKDAPRE